jgi:hypothetical protein
MADDNQSSQSTGDQTDNNQTSQDAQPKWISQLPENLRGNEKLTKHKTLGELGTAFLDLDGKYNPESILIPGEDATDEERATFFNKLGRPTKPEEYEFAETQWPDGIEDFVKTAATEDIEAFRPIMHELGITKKQAQTLIDKYISFGIDRWQKSNEAVALNQEKVKKDLINLWGNDYDANIELATRGFEKAGELAGIKDEFGKFMLNSRLGDDPMFIKIFHAIGKAISDDSALDNKNIKGDPRLDDDGVFHLDYSDMKG